MVYKGDEMSYNTGHGGLAQLGERPLDVWEVAGSIPVPSIQKEP